MSAGDQRAVLPFPVKVFNTLTRPVSASMLPLSPSKLMAAAQKTTGLEDFGPDYFRKPLALLCQSLDEDADLTAMGRVIARQDISRLLSNRLKFIDIFKRHPEIAEQQITAPIFILGMPRTGTTSLHELMALDRQFRVPLSWEVAHPFPPPERASYTTDQRIALVDRDLSRVDQLLPGFKHMHPMGAQLPQECVALFSHDFVSMIFDVQFQVRRYQQWLIHEDMAEVFHNHRRWLQLLQWKCPGQTWVLKSPQYLWNIKDMLREYPDARVIQTHRDPIRVAMSIGSLVTTLRSLGSDRDDLAQTTQAYADLLHHGVGQTLAAREQGLLAPERVVDIPFQEFRAGPVEALQRAYAWFDLEMTDSVAQRMHDFLRLGKESERHGKHRYDERGAGLDVVAERARFAAYEEACEVVQEPLATPSR